VIFFVLQTGVTVAIKVILSILWTYVLIKRVEFKRRYPDNGMNEIERFELELNPALEEPLPLYTKDGLPPYEDAPTTHVVAVPSVQAIATEALPVALVPTERNSEENVNANR
jgi:hypothetical protein